MKARQKLEEILQIDQTWDYITAHGWQVTVTRHAHDGSFSCNCAGEEGEGSQGKCRHLADAKAEYENG